MVRKAISGLMAVLFVVGLGAMLSVSVAEAQGCAGANSNFGACVGGAAAPTAGVSLYRRLGGREGIATVVGDFVGNMAADPRVNARFKGMKAPELEKFKSNLSDQICDATGGPCSYLGRDMKTAHKGMKITDAEWNATVENLGKALDKNKVGAAEKKELIGAIAPMRGDIVGQ